ncbi:hypothetical protein PISMIDRAFT_53187, partial [Pisolithus microcarpus 441]
INNFLRVLVNELLEFWEPGVFFSRTAQHRNGRLVSLALVPLVCDVLGARQVGGFLIHADQWHLANTSEERDRIARTHGVRFSELLRLPYWDPIWFTVLDSMHAFFLHAIPQHIRYIWGISP